MLKHWKLLVFVPIMCLGVQVSSAESNINPKPINTTPEQIDTIKLAGISFERGDFEKSKSILMSLPEMENKALEIERWFLLGQISAKQGDYNTAINIFRKILDSHPDLARVRFELAICYMQTKRWYQADYHLRLAMADDNLPDNVRGMMAYYRYIVRQNKNWNIWFNFGAAPDNNVNQANGGTECISTIFGPLCHELIEPESAVGFNFILGGNYEFKFGEHWRWKSDANLYTNIYNKHKFDDLYLSTSTGPRYVWNNGDIWLAGIIARRWYGWDRYNWSLGSKLDINYDFTRKISGGLSLKILNNKYEEYGPWMNGQTYGANGRLFYSIDTTKYVVLRGGIERDTAKDDAYADWRPYVGVGLGFALPWGFDVYMEPSFYWANYDGARWVVNDGWFTKKVAKDFSQRYSVSLSNHKVDIWGFVPTLTIAYSRRDSNIWQREYDKYTAEFTFQQRF